MIEFIMNFLLEIPTWILGGIALLLFILILMMITKLWDTKDIPQPQKKNTALSNQHHKLYPGYVHDPTISPNVADLVRKRIKKKNEEPKAADFSSTKLKNDDDDDKPHDQPKPSKPTFKIIQGGKKSDK